MSNAKSKMLCSDAMDIRPPNVLVHLQLHANVQTAFGYPVCQLLQIDQAPGRRDQNCFGAIFKTVIFDHLACEIPVCTIGDYEFYFVELRPQTFEIWPMISPGFALRQRFASGDLDQSAGEIADALHHLFNRKVLAASESVLAVTPYATHRATRQPHEGAGPTPMGRLALN